MISHDNLYALDLNIGDDMIKPGMKIISYLPCSHIAALSLDVFMSFVHGACCYFADKDALKGELLFYLQSVRPNVFLGVPRVYEKIKSKILTQVFDSNLVRKNLFFWALK